LSGAKEPSLLLFSLDAKEKSSILEGMFPLVENTLINDPDKGHEGSEEFLPGNSFFSRDSI
jgi:hypothetical protein